MYAYLMLGILLLFTGCGPRYIIKNQYIPPVGGISKGCLDNCSSIRNSCQVQCQRQHQYCLDDAYGRAKAVEQDELRAYDMAYSRYLMDFSHFKNDFHNWERDYNDYSRDYDHYRYQCEREKDRYACEKRDEIANRLKHLKKDKPREPWVPVKPSFEQILVTQQSACNTSCGCDESYDGCFVGCGGQVIPQKICVENCN